MHVCHASVDPHIFMHCGCLMESNITIYTHVDDTGIFTFVHEESTIKIVYESCIDNINVYRMQRENAISTE